MFVFDYKFLIVDFDNYKVEKSILNLYFSIK